MSNILNEAAEAADFATEKVAHDHMLRRLWFSVQEAKAVYAQHACKFVISLEGVANILHAFEICDGSGCDCGRPDCKGNLDVQGHFRPVFAGEEKTLIEFMGLPVVILEEMGGCECIPVSWEITDEYLADCRARTLVEINEMRRKGMLWEKPKS